MKDRLLEDLELKNVFGENQSAYRHKRCTTDNLLDLSQYITEAFQWSEIAVLICLDVEKAFDAVWRLGLISKLMKLEVDEVVIRWVNAFLSQRKVYVKLNGFQSSSFSPSAGVPQGSVIAPILFIAYVAGVPDLPCKISQFADDFALYGRSRYPQILEKRMQESLDRLGTWCKEQKIRINAGKTKFIVFKNRKNRKCHIDLRIDDEQLEEAREVRFLGLTYQSNMCWDSHCNQLAKRASQRASQLYKLRMLGVPAKNLIQVYSMWIRPLFTYANAAWITASNKCIEKLQKVQNRALRTCLGQNMSCRIGLLHATSNLPLVRDQQLKLARNYLAAKLQTKFGKTISLITNKRMCPKTSTITPLDILLEPSKSIIV